MITTSLVNIHHLIEIPKKKKEKKLKKQNYICFPCV